MRRPRLEPETQFLILAAAVGSAGALVNHVFRWVVSLCHRLFVSGPHELFAPLELGWRTALFLLAPALGGLAVGMLGRFSGTEVGGYGLPSFLEKVNLRTNELTLRSSLLRAFAAVFTLGSGGSAGAEGPVASLAGGISNWIARTRKLIGERQRVLIACGASAAVAAAYGAPIAGVFFTQEIVLAGNYDLQNFVRVVVASGSATVVARAIRGDAPMFTVDPFELVSPAEVVFYLLLGLVCGLAGALFSRLFFRTKKTFQELKIDRMYKPAIGGALVGVLAIGAPGVLGNGYEVIQNLLSTRSVSTAQMLVALAILVVAKMVATSVTVGSGGAGGIFGPSLALGSVLGSLVGGLADHWAPQSTSLSSHYAMVGMGALLAATVRAPLTSIFLAFEMTGSSSTVVLPTLVAVAAALFVARRLESHSIDEAELARRGIHLKESRELAVLQSVTAGEAMSIGCETIPASAPAPLLQKLASQTRANAFIVVDAEERMVGIVSLQDLRGLDAETAEQLGTLTIASDLCERQVETIYADEVLSKALAKMDQHGFRQLPVVQRGEPRRVVGMLERQHILSAYRRHLMGQAQTRALAQPAPESSDGPTTG